MTLKKISRAAWRMMRYQFRLKNGAWFWLTHRFKRLGPMPPLKFYGGMVWHHGQHDSPDLLFREIVLERYYLPLNAPPKAIVLDIGANIGAVTMYWAQGRPDISFHAYEPNPDAYATLCKNVKANNVSSQVTTYPEAVSKSSGEVELWVDVPTDLSTSYGPSPGASSGDQGRKVSVPAVSLDDVWKRAYRSPIWMLKIDTEGAEGDILEGASDDMLRSVQTACIEWHDNIVPGVRARCVARLKETGFVVTSERVHPWNEGIIFATRQPR